jgi:CDP-diacylglycerol---glycerol-3-phosphate 3-phosphatidyltransferase
MARACRTPLASRPRVNLPNSITMSRICCVPLLIWLFSPHVPWRSVHGAQDLSIATFFLLASITDGVDGFLARKRGQITTLGMLLDPLADKLLISAAFIALVDYNPHVVKPWIATVVIGREFLVSGLRSIASQEGFVIPASDLGKLKTVTQIVAVIAAVLDHTWTAWYWGWLTVPVDVFAIVAVYLMSAISIISATDYFWSFWRTVERSTTVRRESEREQRLLRKGVASTAQGEPSAGGAPVKP